MLPPAFGSASALYVVLRSDAPWKVSLALTDTLTGVTPSSKDTWGFFHVTDLDLDRTASFLLVR